MSDTEPTRTHWTLYLLAISVIFFASVALYKTTIEGSAASQGSKGYSPVEFLLTPCKLSHEYVSCTVNPDAKVTGPSIFDLKLIRSITALPMPKDKGGKVLIETCIEVDLVDCENGYIETSSFEESTKLVQQIDKWHNSYGGN